MTGRVITGVRLTISAREALESAGNPVQRATRIDALEYTRRTMEAGMDRDGLGAGPPGAQVGAGTRCRGAGRTAPALWQDRPGGTRAGGER
jgi:hypothetical protein